MRTTAVLPWPSSMRPVRTAILAAGLLSVLSCGDSSGPDDDLPGQGGLVTIGDTVAAPWNTATRRDYYLRPQNAVTFAVYGDAILDNLVIEVTDSATGAVLTTAAAAKHPPHPSYQLANYHTGLVELAAGQTARIRLIRGTPKTTNARYRFEVAQVLVTPEAHAATLALGDTVNGETMATPVDVDRFYLRNTTGGPAEVALFAQSRAGLLYVAVHDSTTGVLLGSGSFVPDLTVRPVPFTRLSTIPLQNGQAVRIQALQFGAGSGDYQFWLYPVNRAPESVPATIALNDTIQGEILENSADIDEFTLSVGAGVDLIGYYRGPGTTTAEIAMTVSGGGLNPLPGVTNAPSSTLEQLNTGPFVPVSGGTLTISHGTTSNSLVVQHPYTFMLRAIDRQPEQVTPTVSVGDSILGETIGYIGDIDVFAFTAMAGQTVTASVRAVSGFPVVPVQMELVFPGGGILDWAYSTNGTVDSIVATQLPIDGVYFLRLRSRFGGVGLGPYELLLQ